VKLQGDKLFHTKLQLSQEGHGVHPGAQFLGVFRAHPLLIPRLAYPQAVYFLLSAKNFAHAWHEWLGPCLDWLGYDVSVKWS
jgi:hypothetical protein